MTDQRTMIYTVDLGDGNVADVEGPEGATPEQLQAAVAGHLNQSTQEASAEMVGAFADELPEQTATRMSPEDEAAYSSLLRTGSTDDLGKFLQSRGLATDPAKLAQFVQDRDKAKATGKPVNYDVSYTLPEKVEVDEAGALGRGVADTLLMGTLPKVGAAIAGVEGALSGGSFGDSYNRMLDQNNAAIGADEQQHPWYRLAGQLLGGLGLPSGLEGVGLKAGSDVLRAGGSMQEARAAASIAVRNRMAAVGGVYGAAHGAGSADSIPDAITGAAIEGGLGAATGGLMGQAGKRSAVEEKVAQSVDDGRNVMEAAQRQGIDPLPADVGGATTRRLTAVLAQTPAGAGPIINRARSVADQAQAARDRIAAEIGQALEPEAAGNTAASGARSYIAASRQMVGGLYTAAEKAAGNTRIQPAEAIKALDANIRELADTPGGAPGLAHLQGLRDALTGGDVSVAGLRNMRTVLRDQFIKDGLRGSDLERRVGLVLDAARNDVQQGLRNAGKGNAASLYAKADQAYRDRATLIDNTMKPLIGTREKPKSGEQVIKALTADLQSNNARAVKFLRALPPEEQANTRASIIGALGKASAGQQNAAGDAFSLQAFLTNWGKIGDSAKAAYFGPEARAALNDLALVAQGSREAGAYANRSQTGGVIAGLATGATFSAGFPVLLATLGAQYGAGRLLASPRFARWVARGATTSLSPEAYSDRLVRIARAEPAIANDVFSLQQRLTEAFGSSPARLAADERNDSVPVGDRQGGNEQAPQEGLQP